MQMNIHAGFTEYCVRTSYIVAFVGRPQSLFFLMEARLRILCNRVFAPLGKDFRTISYYILRSSFIHLCRIIIVDHRLNTCCAFLPFDLESVKVCPSGSKFGRKPEKHRKMYYAYISSNGKGMYNMKDVQNAIYSIVETRGKDCYCILCHAIDVAIAYPAEYAKDAGNLQ